MSSSQDPFTHRNAGRMSSSNSPSSSNRGGGGGGPFHNHAAHWGSPGDLLDQPFTPEMRDRQARGKDPYSADDDNSDASDASPGGLGGRHHHHHHHPRY